MKTVAIDIEGALYRYLTEQGFNCSAFPQPLDYADNLPYILIERTGGNLTDRVINSHAVSFDVWAETWAQATEINSELNSTILSLENKMLDGVPVYAIEIQSMGYNNPSVDYPTLARVSQNYIITTRTKELKNG